MKPCFHLDKDFKTPPDYAVMKGNAEVMQLVLDTLSFSATTSGLFVQNTLMSALNIAIRENQRQAFRTLAIKYMEIQNWDTKKVEIIKSTNKLLMEAPKPSDDQVPMEVFAALNKLLLSNIQRSWCGMSILENFLASDPLHFRALASRSCPLETQFYFCVLTRQTDDLLDEIYRSGFDFGPDKGLDRVNKYPVHSIVTRGLFRIMKLVLMYGSGSSNVCLLKDMNGDTPLHLAVQWGQVSIINILLSTCWESAGMVSDKTNETALHYALRYNKAKSFKTLLQWYIIKEEFSENNARDWECGDTALDLLVDGYVKIVKELLCQKESKVCFQREFWEGKDYFVVIKCKNKESFGTSFKYQDYIREVTCKTTNRTILSLWMDSRSIITLKVLIRSVMVRGILDVRDVQGYTVFDRLDNTREVRKTDVMGFLPYERFENVIWLLDAVQMGDYEAFSKLLVEDPQILDYVCELPLGGTPLHIAARFGQLNDCTREIIRKRPLFAAAKDHKHRNPLHIASAKGYLEIVKELLTHFGFNQCFASTPLHRAYTYNGGEFRGTPIEYAIERGRIPVIDELLSVWWKCVPFIIREANSDLLRIAVASKQFEALKMLMERYIEDELLKAKEVDGNPMSALADGYIEIVSKHLLSPKVDYRLSILKKNIDNGETTGTKQPLPLYFAVIEVTSTSRRKDNNIIDDILLSAYYPTYFREVTVRNKMVLHLSVDDENSVTLKLLLRSPLYYDDIFDSLLEELKNKVVENEMGILLPIWSNKINDTCRSPSFDVYHDAKKQGESTKNGHDGNEEHLSSAAKDDYGNVSENVKAYQTNDNAKDDEEMPTDVNIPDRLDGYNVRNQGRIFIGQVFPSLEECRHAIKDAAILGKFEVTFTKSTSKRIVAECSNNGCIWKIRAQAKTNSESYVVTEIPKEEHRCPRLNGTTNKLATPIWVSSHIIDNVRQDPSISAQQIKHIMKESKYQIDIYWKTAERAKKRALDIIHSSEPESKKQRRNSFALPSLSSNAYHSGSNLRFLEHISEPMQQYINSIEYVEKDGHCGYRVIAMQSGYKEMDAWKQVRRELLTEVVQNEILYMNLMDFDTVAKMRKAFSYFEDHATDPQYWLSLPDAGYVIANAYKAVVVSLSLKSGNCTFLPLLEPPPEGRPHRIIAFAFVNGNHFISVNLKPDAPIPRVDRRWDIIVSKAAEGWKTPYLDRFDMFEEIMGFKLGQTGEGMNLIDLEEKPESPPTCPEDATPVREISILNVDGGGSRIDASIVVDQVDPEAYVPAMYPNAGMHFEGYFKAPLPGHEIIGGFSVPADHLKLYTQVWQKYGHIATMKKSSHCPTLAGIVANLLPLIAKMDAMTLDTVTEDLLEELEGLMVMSESLDFNVGWLRQRINSIKKGRTIASVSW